MQLYFGLGGSEVESVSILWPDGKRVVGLNGLRPNQAYTIDYNGSVTPR
ncbi:MAG: hypothetical protein GY759_07240 [Chloroflexi bacterium]|nr:hypothetical protein [Chloroflexota bacterium]